MLPVKKTFCQEQKKPENTTDSGAYAVSYCNEIDYSQTNDGAWNASPCYLFSI